MTARLLVVVMLAGALAGCEKHSVSDNRPATAVNRPDSATTATAVTELPAGTPVPVDADAGTAHADPATTSAP